MKRGIVKFLVFALLLTFIPTPSMAAIRSETINICGIELQCDVSDGGILQIMLTQEQQEQITENFWNDEKRIEGSLTIDLSGVSGLNGFAFGFYPELSFVVELIKGVKLFVSPSAAMGIREMSGGKYVVLEAVYSFSEDKRVNGVDLSTTNITGDEIYTVGAICFPVDSHISDTSSLALKKNEDIIAMSGVQDGLFYSALSLTGKYSLVQVTPMEFDDEIPLWAKSTVDWMSARNVVLGRDSGFCPDQGITRAEFFTLFARLYNIRENSDMALYTPPEYKDASDIPDWALILPSFPNLFLGVEYDGVLYPNQIMTRGEMAAALCNYIMFFDMFYDESEYTAPFADIDMYSREHAGGARMLNKIGIFVGYDGKAHLNEVATRAQAAELLCKFAKWSILNRTYR